MFDIKCLYKNNIQQLFIFAVVGSVGFVIDSLVLLLSLHVLMLGYYIGRILSYLVAASTTWILNRTYTFKVTNKKNIHLEWASFVSINLSGGLVNYGVYAILIWRFATFREFPVLGVALGSLSGLLVNFFFCKKFLYNDRC